ncbi:hypothetical protein [Sagittula stellata]|uniref:hypothetical protein n=1 Tax=Sagittula stellata TaxID=52603 RepID=UPI0002E80594|nr:hypothetical protein [Sagittula stellata]
MLSYEEIDAYLGDRYRALAQERDGAPVYAIEHGLNVEDARTLASKIARRLRATGAIGSGISWPLLALTAEIGYAYRGLLSGYWPHLEAALGLHLSASARETLTDHYLRAHHAVGLAHPDNTPFSRAFRHIAWPLTNALAPRQIHAGLSEALLEVAMLDPADSALVRAVQQCCRRSGLLALNDWAAGEARVESVATAILDAPDRRLSRSIVNRLENDMMSAMHIRDTLVRARVERRRRQRERSRAMVDEVEPHGPQDDDGAAALPFELRGGLRLGARLFAADLPVVLHARTPLRFTRHEVSEPERLLTGETARLILSDGEQLVLDYQDERNVRRTTSMRFTRPEPIPSLISVHMEPGIPVLADLREDRLSVFVSLAQPPDDDRARTWPRELLDVEMRLELRIPGAPAVLSRETLPTIPGRLAARGPGLSNLSSGLRGFEDKEETIRAAMLTIRWDGDNRSFSLAEEQLEIRWYEAEDGWRASVPDGSKDLPVRRVPADDPFAIPVANVQGTGAQLLVVDGVSAPNFIVAGPSHLRMTDSRPAAPDVHRQLGRSNSCPGLRAETEAWLSWSSARPVHVVAELQARGAAKVAERAIVNTMCGEIWLQEESRPSEGKRFRDSLAEAVIRLDLAGVAELREVGQEIGEADLNGLLAALADAFADVVPPSCLEKTLDEKWAERADERIDNAWKSLTPARTERSAPPVDFEAYNAPEAWQAAVAHAVRSSGRHVLAAMILPPRLSNALRNIDYQNAETLEVARAIADFRIDRGSLARQARRISGSDIPVALSLWTDPRAFAMTDWLPIVTALFEDRMTARAIRYAALRLRTARWEVE